MIHNISYHILLSYHVYVKGVGGLPCVDSVEWGGFGGFGGGGGGCTAGKFTFWKL